MPIISKIGRRSWKVRFAIALIYTLLIIGALSMLYPMLLMLSGSAKSETDFAWVSPVPQYFFDDGVLWMKYIETKYGVLPDAESALHRQVPTWRSMRPPALDANTSEIVRLFQDFRRDGVQGGWPTEWYTLGFSLAERTIKRGIPAKNTRLFRAEAQKQFGTVEAYSDAAGVRYPSWAYVGPPRVPFAARRFTYPDSGAYRVFYDIKAKAPLSDRVVTNIDGEFWRTYLLVVWSDVNKYNAAHGTRYASYDQVLLSTTPPHNPSERADWDEFVRRQLGLAFIRVDPRMTEAYRKFLRTRYKDVHELNVAWETNYQRLDDIPLPVGVIHNQRAQVDFAAFIKNSSACPLDALSVYGPRQAFEEYVSTWHGRPARAATNTGEAPVPRAIPLPIDAIDYADFQSQKPSLRWEFMTRNYLTVWDYICAHGNGVRNTFILCTLMVLANLIVNPLAAYALSRYKPPSAYTVLLFCMCTMAFPAEVTMIPSFLLLKDFHLLNTFAALVLPAMANGFSIFLLKGFFDSLPRELYEAAELYGAGEWTKFWLITMTLSKPILAVLALSAFTAAYTEFMMALVIIPDPSMWTLMVWLFQMQSFSHPSVVYASLVIAAVPTMLIFLFCQNLIMRGIVVPSEK